MFLFKCCSNHSLPNFLKSTKGQPSPVKTQVSISSPNFHGRCSDEVVNDFSDVLDNSTDVDFGYVDIKKATSSIGDLSHKKSSFSDESGRKIVINSIRKAPVEVHSYSSNSIVLLVGDSRVKTKLFKHHPSLTCNSLHNPENKTQIFEKRFSSSDDWKASWTSSKKSISKEEDFLKSFEVVSVDHAEFIVTREKQNLKVDESQIKALKEEKATLELSEDLEGDIEKPASYLVYSDVSLGNIDVSNNSSFSSFDDSKINDIINKLTHNVVCLENHKTSGEVFDQSMGDNSESIERKDFSTFQSKAWNVETDSNKSKQDEAINELHNTNSNRTTSLFQTEEIDISKDSSAEVGKLSDETEITKSKSSETTSPKQLGCNKHLVSSQTSDTSNDRETLDSKHREISDDFIDEMFSDETASFFEDFLPSEDYLQPIQFFSDLPSPSTSDDSAKIVDEVSTSNDSLLTDKSPQAVFRPSDFEHSNVIFASSCETSDESGPNTSGNNSVTDSLLESPESPGGGLDFRHFYSKSLPNLDKQPYDSMSSIGLIEEYFNRYIIESKDVENLESQVENSDKSCLGEHNRNQSLEKLTEICKKFSSTYLNFLQSSRESSDLECSNDKVSDSSCLNSLDKKDQESDKSSATLTALYAAIFPFSDSKDNSRAKTPPINSDPDEPTSSVKPSFVGRSVSLLEPSIPAARKKSKKKKAVKFADSFGLELAIVRLILSGENLSDQEFHQRMQTSSHINNISDTVDDNANRPKNCKISETRRIVAEFVQPENSDNFMQMIEAQNVILESCLPEEKSRSVSGCIRVKNLSYEKTVLIRYTLNEWLSYNETLASYVFGSNDGHSDRFSFSIKLPSFFDIGYSIEFAILFKTHEGTEYWDNNCGFNYRMTCQKC